MRNISTIIFDVNETLLDLSPLKDSIDSKLGEGAAEVWFAELLQYSLVESISGSYHDFSKIAEAVLQMNGSKKGIELTREKIQQILDPITKLEAYPDVEEGLSKLGNAGFKLIAFSNGKPSVLKDQLYYAGIANYFDEVLSVDAVKKYKPHPETYRFALKRSDSIAQETVMVAAHGWDIAGADRAGLKTAFMQRPGKFLFPLSNKPTWELKKLSDLAEILKDI
ncbi:haloacid dehalogenase type II [Christiangramia sabulilitoris]|uniref:Haloacid dehalogenase type II n=1 Tax=Christiangramia sabulilitoris TaxID=2583991 RepID=A0A550I958_9FLAO|nr:haloacid dehalogenase type II [Christiangramia sabulilitoris]TRO67517.1 haloacid dehalogenase type II [Christiangramia sabulilitoris]